MKQGYKRLVTILAILFSLVAGGIGVSLVGTANIDFETRFIYNFVFIMQALATMWVGIGLFRKEKWRSNSQ